MADGQPRPAFYVAVLLVVIGLVGLALWRFGAIGPGGPGQAGRFSTEELKQKGYWIYGLDERGDHDYDKVEFTAPTAIVLGSEGKGLHQLVKEHCDFLVRIPLVGKISSLNVSTHS